jgi:cytochrome c oxidase assembly factor CtaG/putative copper export protein
MTTSRTSTTPAARRDPGPGRPSDRPGQGGVLWRWLAATLLLAGVTLVVVLVTGGGAPKPSPAGLPDAGPVTGWGLPASRLVADLAGVTTLGLLLSAGFLLPSKSARLSPVSGRGTQLAVRAAMVWAAAVAVETALTVSDIFGSPPNQVLSATVLRSFVTQIPQGRALAVQLVLALLVAGVARSVLTSRGAAIGAVLALITLTPPTLTGHSAATGNHELAVASLMVHVLAAATWTGGLGALAWAGFAATKRGASAEPGLRYAVSRFSLLAAICCATVAVSGVVNAQLRLGDLGAWFTTPYGRIVLVKAAALLVLATFGWWHRRHTVTQLAADTSRVRSLFVRVAAAEVVIMACTMGVAVGLARTPTPVGATVDETPSTELLGFKLPPAPTPARLAFGWTPDGFAIAFILAAVLLYAAGVWTLRRRGDAWPWGRVFAWYAGVLVVAWATVGGLGLYSHVMFSAHMAAHMLLSMVAPIGLVLGAPVTLALRSLPGPRVPGELGLRQMLMKVLQSWPVRVLAHPIVAAVLFVASLYAIYFTGLFSVLMSEHLGHVVMWVHFVGVGCLFFWVLVGVDPTPIRLPPLARIGLLMVIMPFHAFFSVEVMTSSTVVARAYYAALDRPYATDLLADQRLGAGTAWALGEVPILLVMAAVFVQWIRSDARDAARADRDQTRGTRSSTGSSAGSEADTELGRYNAYLAQLSQHSNRNHEERQRRE